MQSDEEFLITLADAVLEGRSLDWEAIESEATDSQRDLIRHLRSVAAISTALSAAELEDLSPATSTSHGAPAASIESLRGGQWGHLSLMEPVGRGAFGTVYRAFDPQLHREVALKLLPASDESDTALREGRLLARIRHPNVVTIYGADRIGDVVGFWMELVAGETLDHTVAANGPLPPDRVLDIGRHLCDALGAVHRAGLVHRDVKPRNVMLEPTGRVVLMDFGTGHAADDRTSSMAGTPLFLAPEAFGGRPAGARGDQYSLGVLLFFALTGRYPAAGDTFAQIRDLHSRGLVKRNAREFRPDTPRHLARAIAQALAPDPEGRFGSMADMAAALVPRRPGVSRMVAAGLAAAAAAAVIVGMVPAVRGFLFPPGGGHREVLPSIAATSTAPSNRRLELPSGLLFGNGLSYDGRVYAFASADGPPAVFHLDSGESETLPSPSSDGYAEWAIASPDGAALAYQWWPASGPCELHVVSLSDRSDRVVLREVDGTFPVPMEWSRDGSKILVMLKAQDGARQAALLDVADGSLKTVYEIRNGNPGTVRLSPDNRYLALDLPDDSDPPRWSIRIVTVESGSERVLLPADLLDNRFGLWTPDGSHIFFVSNRAGTPDGWVVPVADGVATAEPKLVAQNLARVSSLNIVASGAFYYRVQSGQFDVEEVNIDPSSFTVTSPARVIRTATLGSNISPSYSRDGSHMAFVSQRTELGGDLGSRVLVIRDRRTGEERELRPPLNLGVLAPAWSHDDRHLLIRGTNRHNQWGVFVLDTQTGFIENEIHWPERDQTEYGRAVWAAGDKAIVFEHSARGLVRHSLDSGMEETVLAYERYPALRRISFFEYAPDDATLAVSTFPKPATAQDLTVIDPGNAMHTVASAKDGRRLAFQGWLPGGQHLLYSVFGTGASQKDELWLAPQSGGIPQPLGISIAGRTSVNRVSIDPSGTALAFTTGVRSNTIWMMEHFLGGF